MEFTRPQLTPKVPISRRLIERLVFTTFDEGPHPSPYHEGYNMTPKDLVSRVVTLTNGDDIVKTFLLDQWFPNGTEIKIGDRVVAKIPLGDAMPGQGEDVVGNVVRIDEPVGFGWLRTLLKAGNMPPLLRETTLTFDVECSVLSVVDMKGTIWRWPKFSQVDPISHLAVMTGTEGAKLRRREIPLSHKIPVRNEAEEGVIKALVLQHEDAIHQACGVMAVEESLLCMLPVSTMVKCTVTKTIEEWRSWLQSMPTTYEGAFLRDQFFKYFLDAVEPCFSDCHVASENLKRYKKDNNLP